MQQVFIELYNYRPAWAKCPESERTDFAKKVIEAVKGLKSAGIDVVAYGMNSSETDRRAPYDFFCVYRVPNVEFQRVRNVPGGDVSICSKPLSGYSINSSARIRIEGGTIFDAKL